MIWLACDVCGNLLVCLGFLGICGRFAGVFGICWYFVDNLVVGLGFLVYCGMFVGVFGICFRILWKNLLVYFGFFWDFLDSCHCVGSLLVCLGFFGTLWKFCW